MSDNPFQIGGALLATSPIYIERQADIEARHQLHKMNYITLIEPRQQGKTSLISYLTGHMGATEQNPDRPYRFAVADLTDWKGLPEENWYKALCDFMLDQLWFISDDERPELPSNSRTWLRFLANLGKLAKQAQVNLVIALDEVGATSQEWATSFYSTIRSIFNYRQNQPHFRHLTFILAGAYNPRTLIKDPRISPFNIAQQVHLKDFTVEQVRLLTTHLTAVPETQTLLAECIHHWTDGQPYLTQWFCHALVGRSLSKESVDIVVKQLRSEDSNHLPHVFEAFSGNQNHEQYVKRVAKGYNPPFTPADSRLHMQLALAGIIKADEQGRCKIRNRVYEQVLMSELEVNPRNLVRLADQPALSSQTSDPSETQASKPRETLPVSARSIPWIRCKLQIAGLSGLKAEVRADTPMGQPKGISQLPYNAGDLIAILKALHHRTFNPNDFSQAQIEVLQKHDLLQGSRFVAHMLSHIGHSLYRALCPGEVKSALRMALNQARTQPGTVALQLCFDADAVSLARYPWELLHDGHRSLLSSGVLELTRYITYAEAPTPLKVSPPWRLLYITSRPVNLDPLPADDEQQTVRDSLQPLALDGRLAIDEPSSPTYDGLLDALSANPYHIMHFDGHGDFARKCPSCQAMNYAHLTECAACQDSLADVQPSGYLAFEDEDRQVDYVDAETIENALFGTQVRLAVISACVSATVRGETIFGGVGPGLIRSGIPAVVAMQLPIQAQSAVKFTKGFYISLTKGDSIPRAVAQGRRRLFRDRAHFIPTLYLRSSDDEGKLFVP